MNSWRAAASGCRSSTSSCTRICAFQYYGRMKEDRKAAWKDYLRLCRAGGTKGYFELLETGNLLNPFVEGTVEKATGHVIAEIRERYGE